MFARWIDKLAVADRTGVVLLGAATATRGLVYTPWTPSLHYTHPVEAVASASSWATAWIATATLLLVSGMIAPRSKPATAAWALSIMLHIFFGASMAIAVIQGVADGYLSGALCFCVAGFAIWGSARKKPHRTEVLPA